MVYNALRAHFGSQYIICGHSLHLRWEPYLENKNSTQELVLEGLSEGFSITLAPLSDSSCGVEGMEGGGFGMQFNPSYGGDSGRS